MMRKTLQSLLILSFVSLIFLPNVYAESSCDYESQLKLQKAALDVQVNYEAGDFSTGEFEDSEMLDENGEVIQYELTEPRVDVTIYNISEDIYVTVLDKSTSEEETYYYEDTVQGVVSWSRYDLSDIVEYEVKIYSDLEDCRGEELNKISIVTPKLNPYNAEDYCVDVDKFFCQEFITQEINMSEEDVRKSAYQAQQENTSPNEEPTSQDNFWKKNGAYLIASVIIVLIGVVAAVIIVKKQRRKVL